MVYAQFSNIAALFRLVVVINMLLNIMKLMKRKTTPYSVLTKFEVQKTKKRKGFNFFCQKVPLGISDKTNSEFVTILSKQTFDSEI